MYPFPIATKQKCNVQEFYSDSTWNKPAGVSHVYMLLIGAGATGTGAQGAGSGAVTVWYGAAQHIPDTLRVVVGRTPGTNNTLIQAFTNSGVTTLLTAVSPFGTSGGSAATNNYFSVSGLFTGIIGQDGSVGTVTPSSVTFLSGGSGTGTTGATSNYNYKNTGNGYFQLQPIIVGTGAGSATGKGGIGCGGGQTSGAGGDGFVLIASW